MDPSFYEILLSKINVGNELISDLKNFSNVGGIEKLQRKLIQEKNFLEKLQKKTEINPQQINCTNLNYFKHLVNSLYIYDNQKILHVLYPVHSVDNKTIRIDIVAGTEESQYWIKIISRNPKSIINCVEGNSEYGSKSILDFAEEYLAVAELRNHFKKPKIIFDFFNEIDDGLKKSLEDMGVLVRTNNEKPPNILESDENNKKKLNLDITSLIAYVSQLTNGGKNWKFQERILTEQAELERKEPLKPLLDSHFYGKELICCKTAFNSFKEILDLLGGEQEKARSAEFLSNVKILPDVPEPKNILNLNVSAQIKERSLKIFAFGVFHKATTITSNSGFVRSAQMQNIDVPVIIHSARALTERKEETGQVICD